jgi:hypothetical protein
MSFIKRKADLLFSLICAIIIETILFLVCNDWSPLIWMLRGALIVLIIIIFILLFLNKPYRKVSELKEIKIFFKNDEELHLFCDLKEEIVIINELTSDMLSEKTVADLSSVVLLDNKDKEFTLEDEKSFNYILSALKSNDGDILFSVLNVILLDKVGSMKTI